MKNLIKFFSAAPTGGKKLDVTRVVSEGAKRGYLIHLDACTQDVMDFLEMETYNPNSTFYRTWADITEKTRFELFIDQILHYTDVYVLQKEGRNGAEIYCPNGEPINIPYNTYTVIRAVSPREMFDMCVNCINAGAALAEVTLKSIVSYIVYCVNEYHFPLDLDAIGNRDALCIISNELGMFPTSGVGIVRCLYYKVFGNPMPIQGHMQLNALHGRRTRYSKAAPTADVSKVDLTGLTDKQMKALASVFLRYKKFLLGLKHNRKNAPIINRLRRMAVTYHKPMTPGFWENITNFDRKYVAEHLEEELNKLDNNFKITRLIQMFDLRRQQNVNRLQRTFTVRNGKMWTDKDSIAPYAGWWCNVRQALILRLVENLKAKRQEINPVAVYVKFPKRLELACPVSEKKFLGNVPFGSSYDLVGANNYFGVYWRNEWGTRDFDLSYMDDGGHKLGWDSDYYNEGKSIVFSGDMTNADPEATEMFYAAGQCVLPNGNLMLNRFNGEPDSKYRIFLGQENLRNFGKGYMVDPNTIKFSEMGKSTAQQQLVGRFHNNRFLVCVADVAGGRVSYANTDFNESFAAQANSYLPLKDILLQAGFQEWTEKIGEDGIEPTIDLTDLKKDTLLNLFS